MPARIIKPPLEAGSLLLAAQKLLYETELTHAQIFLDTGLPIPWLTCLVRGQVTDPGVNRVQKLYEYLCGTKLKV